MLNAADLTHNSGMEEWDNEVDITCCTFGAPAAGNKGKNHSKSSNKKYDNIRREYCSHIIYRIRRKLDILLQGN